MNLTVSGLYLTVLILLILILGVGLTLFIKKYVRYHRETAFRKEIGQWLKGDVSELSALRSGTLLKQYLEIRENVELSPAERSAIEASGVITRATNRCILGLRSPLRTRRLESASFLGRIGSEEAAAALTRRLGVESNSAVKLQIASALAEIKQERSIEALIDSLIGSHRFYRERINMILVSFGGGFEEYLPNLLEDERLEIKELLVDYAGVYVSRHMPHYLLRLIDQREEDLQALHRRYGGSQASFAKQPPVAINYSWNYKQLVYKACRAVAAFYPELLAVPEYTQAEDVEIRNIAIRALANDSYPGRREALIIALRDPLTAQSAEYVLTGVLEQQPAMIKVLARYFENSKIPAAKAALARTLAPRISYFIMKLNGMEAPQAEALIEAVLRQGRNSEVVDFMNRNDDRFLEDKLVAIILRLVAEDPSLIPDLAESMHERLRLRCGLRYELPESSRSPEPKNKLQARGVLALMLMSVLIIPILYIIRHYDIILTAPLEVQASLFVVEFNYYLAFYSIAISSVYLLLLLASLVSINKQSRLWRSKSRTMLFRRKMLPSISIIAPAYNEEKTIIESTNSLLNLQYPDYELIVVNDGSKDDTLRTLIRTFNLVRVNRYFDEPLGTRPIRGIYVNKELPKLIVVDKLNGGKADALNTGINVSQKEYFCGIDADSLLERDALLKLAAQTLDEQIETPALGGNIFPLNGSDIEQGTIKKRRLSKNPLVRFQTMEYIRAFMAGRAGWEEINSLLIISGAFGLFRKERVIDVGGYLTSTGIYKRDTVGEDMELVVRINRMMREKKRKFRIRYAFNANCWTEVPEDLGTLKNQRFRWHRGLIETLSIHRGMLFNANYGRIGLLAMPYFFIFEFLGPLIEAQGYIMVFIAVIFGLLDAPIMLLLLISNVLLGMLISVSSLFLADMNLRDMSVRAILVLFLYSIIENFGPRQLFSIGRIGAYFEILKKPSAWNKAERIGFQSVPETKEKVQS